VTAAGESRGKTKRRRPVLAAVANLLFAPLGHFYVGRPRRGLGIYVAFLFGGAAVAFGLAAVSWELAVACALLVAIAGQLAICADAFRLARHAGDRFEPGPLNRWYVYAAVIVATVVAGESVQAFIRNEIVQAFVFPTGSMQATLLPGDHVLVDKSAYRSASPQRHDVVVFEYPEDADKDYVKRIVGLPGETIELKDGVVFINGETVLEPFAVLNTSWSASRGRNYGPFVIPERAYFVMGDNRDHSHDSRHWGPVDVEKIYGRVRTIYWSWQSEDSSVRWSRIGTIVE
jgi:signal peptidase I